MHDNLDVCILVVLLPCKLGHGHRKHEETTILYKPSALKDSFAMAQFGESQLDNGTLKVLLPQARLASL